MTRQKGLGPVWIFLVAGCVVILMMLLGASGRSLSILDRPLTVLDGRWTYEAQGRSGVATVEKVPQDSTSSDVMMYRTDLPDHYNDPHSLMFCSVAQKIIVSVDGITIYSFGYPPHFNEKIPSGGYHLMPIPSGSQGKVLELRLENFPGVRRGIALPEVTIGQGYTLLASTMLVQSPTLVLGMIVLLMGIVLIIFGVIMASHRISTEGLLFLGLFAVLVGLWAFLSTNLPQMLLGSHQSLMAVKLTCIMLCAAPFGMFVMHTFSPRYPWAFRILTMAVIAHYIVIGIVTLSLPEGITLSLISTHVLILAMCLLIIYTLVDEAVRKIHADALWILSGFSVLLAGIIIDIIRYYYAFSYNNSRYFMIGLLVFTALAGYKTVSRLASSYNQGIEAETFKKIAFTDILTGLPNRAAFEQHLEDLREEPVICSKSVIVMLDLDHLKQINDNFGHKAGDAALRKVANLIETTYKDSDGKCYRIGGDEFAVVMDEKGKEHIEELTEKLHKQLGELNAGSIIPLSISSGYAVGTLTDAANPYMILDRADTMMYRSKRQS